MSLKLDDGCAARCACDLCGCELFWWVCACTHPAAAVSAHLDETPSCPMCRTSFVLGVADCAAWEIDLTVSQWYYDRDIAVCQRCVKVAIWQAIAAKP